MPPGMMLPVWDRMSRFSALTMPLEGEQVRGQLEGVTVSGRSPTQGEKGSEGGGGPWGAGAGWCEETGAL
jgi:hypothetical protein